MEPFFRQYRAFVSSGDDEGNFFNHIIPGDLSPHEFVDVFLTSHMPLRSSDEPETSNIRRRVSPRATRIMQVSLVLCTLAIGVLVAMGSMKWKSHRHDHMANTDIMQIKPNGTDVSSDWNGEDSPFAPESETNQDTNVQDNGDPTMLENVPVDASEETIEGSSTESATENSDPEGGGTEETKPSDENPPENAVDREEANDREKSSNVGDVDPTVKADESQDVPDVGTTTEVETGDGPEPADSDNGITKESEDQTTGSGTSRWSQLSPSIDGTVPKSFFGSSVALSRDGTRMVVTAEQYSPTMADDEDDNDEDNERTYPGLVQVYERAEDGTWDRVGGDIIGMLKREYRGYTVDISGDGSRIVTGSSLIYLGTAKVYELVGGEWFPLGEAIENLATDTLSISGGQAVAISDDGSTIAVGADVANAPIRVFKYDDYENRWVQKGQDIKVGYETEQKHRSVRLSSSGDHVAISTVPKDGTEPKNGSVMLYKYQFHKRQEKLIWKLAGKAVNGDAHEGNFGFGLSISGDANRLAVSSPSSIAGEAGKVFVYELEDDNSEWTALGNIVGRDNAGQLFGTSVSLSLEGERLAVGAFFHDSTGLKEDRDALTSQSSEDSNLAGAGLVYIYELRKDDALAESGTEPQTNTPNLRSNPEDSPEATSKADDSWVEIGRVGAAENDDVWTAVFSISISGDGDRLALGAPKTDVVSTLQGEDGNEVRVNLAQVGQVRVYDYHELEV